MQGIFLQLIAEGGDLFVMATDNRFSGNVSFRAKEDTETLIAIEQKHGTPPGKFAELLTKAACTFFREHGFFTFPAKIEPELFQRNYIAAKTKGGAVPKLTPVAAARAELRKKDRAAAAAEKKKRDEAAAARQ